jgi:glutaredoxin
VKEFLSRADVAFTVRDVDEDDGAYEELVERGWRAVPVTFVGDRAIKGFDPVALREALSVYTGEGRHEQ